MSGVATLGEWTYDPEFKNIVTDAEFKGTRTCGYGCGNNFIADLDDDEYHCYSSESERDANGHMLAASPNLLAACEFGESSDECFDVLVVAADLLRHQNPSVALALARKSLLTRAAIRKARGQG